MLSLKKTLIFTLVLVSSFSAFAAEKAKTGKEPAKGTVGGAGGNSRGLKDTLPLTIEHGKLSSGITLQPPQLNDNPAATLVVETAGNPTASLNVTAYKCKVSDDGLAHLQSCERSFSGSTNSPIKILPGNYLITAAMNSNGSTTIYNEKPIQIRAGETRRLTLKPVIINPTVRLLKAYISIDFSNREELKKYSAFHWANQSAAQHLFAPLEVTCKANTYNGECGHSHYVLANLNILANALCYGTDADVQAVLAEMAAGRRSRHDILFVSSEETSNALLAAFKSERLLQTNCGKKFPEDIFATTFTSKGRDERIHYEHKAAGYPLYKIERSVTAINLTWDENTKHVTLALEEKKVNTLGWFHDGILTGATQLSINKDSNSAPAAYVFPGTYTVTYDFIGNWDNTDKTLTQTQYGQVVE